MILENSQRFCRDLFDLESSSHSVSSRMNLRLRRKRGFHGDEGFGIYLFKFDKEILYAGSYCGSAGVSKDRWWTHLAGITCRFQETNFTNLSSKLEPTLNALIACNDNEAIERLLLKYKARFEEVYSNVVSNKAFKADVYDKLMGLTSQSSKHELRHLLGDGRCSTFVNRVEVANANWDVFRELSISDIGNLFSFTYTRISAAQSQSALASFLYNNNSDAKLKKRLVQRYIEVRIIKVLAPPANKSKEPIDGTEFDKDIRVEAAEIVHRILDSEGL